MPQHTDTSKNTEAWAVSQHTDTSNNTKAWAVSQHTDTSNNTKAWVVPQHTDTSNPQYLSAKEQQSTILQQHNSPIGLRHSAICNTLQNHNSSAMPQPPYNHDTSTKKQPLLSTIPQPPTICNTSATNNLQYLSHQQSAIRLQPHNNSQYLSHTTICNTSTATQ